MKYATVAAERQASNAARKQTEEAVESPQRKLAGKVGIWAKGDGMSRFRKRSSAIAVSPTIQDV